MEAQRIGGAKVTGSEKTATDESKLGVLSPPAGGQYQIVVTAEPNGLDCKVFVFEPTTGRSWFRSTNQGTPSWHALGAPTDKK